MGQIVEARHWAELVLPAGTEVPPAARANASFVVAAAALAEGNDAAVTLAEHASSLAPGYGGPLARGVQPGGPGGFSGYARRHRRRYRAVAAGAPARPGGRGLPHRWHSPAGLLRGEVDQAERYAEEYVALAQRTGDVLSMAHARNYAASVAPVRQDRDRATDLLTASIPLAVKVGQPDIVAYGFMGLAVVAAGEDPGRAARLFGAAERLLETAGANLRATRGRLYTAPVEKARAALGTASFDAAWTEGRAMTPEQAVAYALGQPTASS